MPDARSKSVLVKPPALRRGDCVAIVAPASNIQQKNLEAGCARLREMGYEPVYDPGIFDQDLYFAGSLDRRIRELQAMFERDDVSAIVCARGGYGANYLLPKLDLEIIRRHPKILVGYSDVTCLLTWLLDSAGLVTFHGPMVAKDFATENGIDEISWHSALGGLANWEIASHQMFGLNPLITGRAEGVLYGGCLSILAASLGTPFEAKTEGKLLFLEDVAAKPYQIDRMLMQLKLAGKFNGIRGILFGEMMDCIQGREQAYTLQEVVSRIIGDLGVPVAYGLRSGHVSRENATLPLGVRVALNVSEEAVRIEFIESAVNNPETKRASERKGTAG